MSDIVRTEGLVKRYDGTLAVAGVDLSVEPGEIFGLVGPNGAGKTTTLRILATLLLPSAGNAEIAGLSVTRNPDQVRRVLGFMPDAFGVYDDMKVWEYLDFFARCYGIAPGRPAADDRRPAGARRPRPTSATTTSRRCRAACSSGCAWPTPSSTTRRCCSSTSRPPASTRAPGSSCASCSASCARWARRSSSAATSSPSSRSCARASPSSIAARCWPRAGSSDIERRLRFGAVLRVRAAARGRGPRGGPRPVRRRSRRRHGGPPRRRHDRARLPRRRRRHAPGCWPSPSRAGLPIVSFARAASDLEELFLQVTAPDREPLEAA